MHVYDTYYELMVCPVAIYIVKEMIIDAYYLLIFKPTTAHQEKHTKIIYIEIATGVSTNEV